MRLMRYGLVTISATNANNPTGAMAATNAHRAPAAKRTATETTSIRTAVPKSSSAIRPQRTLTAPSGIAKPHLKVRRRACCRTAYQATMIGTPHLAISLGCRPMGPILIHRRAPFTSRPIPGTCTKARLTKIAAATHVTGVVHQRAPVAPSRSTGTNDPTMSATNAPTANHVCFPRKMPSVVVGCAPDKLRLAELTMTVATIRSPRTARMSPWLERNICTASAIRPATDAKRTSPSFRTATFRYPIWEPLPGL